MKKADKKRKGLSTFLWMLITLTLLSAGTAHAQDEPIRIGVLAKRGKQTCLQKWEATADYLGEKIPDESFVIVPLDFEDVYPAVENRRVDFILANSSFYVELEAWYGVSRIATLSNSRLEKAVTVFGGVLFCRADNREINSLADLKGKRFMACKETSFGGWRTAWRELKEQGIEPEGDFAALEFGGTHDRVVLAVMEGEVDAGTVRTDTLERMAAEGKIDIKDFKIINRVEDDFPFVHSTRLYPEWPFAKLKHTSNDLAEEVSAALLTMSPDSKAARDAKCSGWTVPLNYQPVRDCLKELRVGPYKDLGRVALGDAVKQHWHWLAAGAVFLLLMAVATMYTVRLNRRLSRIQSALQEELSERKQAEEVLAKRTGQLEMSERRQKMILENSPTGMMMINASREIVEINAAALDILVRTRKEILGRVCHKFVCPADKGNCPIFDKGETIDVSERVALNSRGEEIPILKSVATFEVEGETMLLEAFVDITERKLAEEEIQAARKKAESASRELETKVGELERFNRLAVGREKKMIELKRQVNALCEKVGEAPPYDLSFDEIGSGNTRK